MATITAKLKELVDSLEADEQKFSAGNNSAGTRMRKTLQEIKRIAADGRKEVQKSKNAEAAAD